MKIKLHQCKELELPLAMKALIDRMNQLRNQMLHSMVNDAYKHDPSVISQLDAVTHKFYTRLGMYIREPKLYDLHGYYLYKFNGERNVLKHPQYKIKFV